MENELIGISSRYKRVQRRKRSGVITQEEYEVAIARTQQDMLELLNEAL